MHRPRTLALLLGIGIVVVSSLYLGYIIQDGSSPLAILSPRAAGGDSENELLAQNILSPSPTPTPSVIFQSTSPTPTTEASATISQSPSPTETVLTPAVEVSPTVPNENPSPTDVSPTAQPTYVQEVIYVTATPSVGVNTLPVAGVGDGLKSLLIGGGAIILLGMLL